MYLRVFFFSTSYASSSAHNGNISSISSFPKLLSFSLFEAIHLYMISVPVASNSSLSGLSGHLLVANQHIRGVRPEDAFPA